MKNFAKNFSLPRVFHKKTQKMVSFTQSFFSIVVLTSVYSYPKLSILQKIRQDQNLTTFSKLLELTALSKNSLYYSEVTVFAATNEAFNKFPGKVNTNLTNYHMVYSVYKLNELIDGNLESINADFPPLWVKKRDNEIYVNNAMILTEKSNYFAKNMPSRYGKDQILHLIDEVLDGSLKKMVLKNPTAYDFLNQTHLWGNYETIKFFTKIISHHCENYFKKEGEFTFFIPLDSGINEQRFNLIDSYIIKGHIIKNKVLFTRASLKDHFYDTLTNDNYIQIKIAFSRFFDSFQIKSSTLIGDTNHLTGEIKAEILIANIPVKNGVIHLISKPLGVFDEKLNKFPYLDVFDKFSMDPYLNVSYYLGSRSGFNLNLKQNLSKKKFTFFIPRDFAWKLIETDVLMHPSHLELVKTILSRHLIVSDVPYFMDSLVDGSKDGCMFLNTPNGKICFGAAKDENFDGKFYVIWNGIYVEVYRADYECKNGIVHVIDRPFMTGDEIEKVLNEKKDGGGVLKLWGAVLSLIFSKKN
nr:fasciclin-1-like [Onthophagus taurus]